VDESSHSGRSSQMEPPMLKILLRAAMWAVSFFVFVEAYFWLMSLPVAEVPPQNLLSQQDVLVLALVVASLVFFRYIIFALGGRFTTRRTWLPAFDAGDSFLLLGAAIIVLLVTLSLGVPVIWAIVPTVLVSTGVSTVVLAVKVFKLYRKVQREARTRLPPFPRRA